MKSAFANLLVSWPKTMKIGLGPLFPNADTINFDDEQLPAQGLQGDVFPSGVVCHAEFRGRSQCGFSSRLAWPDTNAFL